MKGQIGKMCFFRISEGEDLAEAIERRAKESDIKAGVFILIGTLERATLGYYKEGEYKHIQLDCPLEIASCMGNVTVDEKGDVIIHAHVVVSNEKGEAFGGHVMKNSPVGVTAELVIIECAGINLQRAFDEKTKLNLLKLN
ncbi:MAG: DNA-binding protein [Candidatus Bathyarchaeota archaeon]|nr:DNA-binding protein [Candidatus Bathyarchaeota archaeon]